jgi:hypothetical protein
VQRAFVGRHTAIFALHYECRSAKMMSIAADAGQAGHAMRGDMCPMNMKLAKDQREALGMLAASLRGRVESVMQAHGFAIGTLHGLVQEGLATADRGPTYFNPHAIVTMLEITEAGRRAMVE